RLNATPPATQPGQLRSATIAQANSNYIQEELLHYFGPEAEQSICYIKKISGTIPLLATTALATSKNAEPGS
ncbi:hypothetical protein, partial [Burkholderia sola]|uniref:hypothetical protein n=1 Tax=Burkholderia sola TaxID=2843302 RepID=UPI00338F6D7A